MLGELVLNCPVVALRVGRLIVQSDSAQCQAAIAYAQRIERNAGHTVLDCARCPVGISDGSDGGDAAVRSVGQSDLELERIVISEAWISAAVFEGTVEDTESATG